MTPFPAVGEGGLDKDEEEKKPWRKGPRYAVPSVVGESKTLRESVRVSGIPFFVLSLSARSIY